LNSSDLLVVGGKGDNIPGATLEVGHEDIVPFGSFNVDLHLFFL